MKRLICLVAAMTGLLASAKTTTWQGASGASWNVSGNWNNGVPESGDTVELSGSSVNDIEGLTLASLQFSGAGAALSGESLTLSAGESSLVFADGCTCTVSAPLVLSAGDNTISVGTGTTVTFAGVISGAGRPCFVGQNTYVSWDNSGNQLSGKISWASIVHLTAENTFSGGMKTQNTTF